MVFGFHFGAQNLPKMSPDCLQKPSQEAPITKRSDFGNCGFVLIFAVHLDQLASQEGPKTAKKPPKVPPKGQQTPFQKKVNFLIPLNPKSDPMAPKSAPKIVQKTGSKYNPKRKQKVANLEPKNGPQNPQIGGPGLPANSAKAF